MHIILLTSFTIVFFTWSCNSAASDGYNLVLQHDLGDGNFTDRAIIHFPSLKGDEAELLQQHERPDIQGLLKLKNQNTIYRIRIRNKLQPSSTADNEKDGERDYVMGFIFVDELLKAGFQDVIKIHTDGLGNVIALSIETQQSSMQDSSNSDTILHMTQPQAGAVPDTVGFLNKVEEEKKKKEIAEKEPKSFFAKYWMYILPVIVFMMMSNAAQQQQQ